MSGTVFPGHCRARPATHAGPRNGTAVWVRGSSPRMTSERKIRNRSATPATRTAGSARLFQQHGLGLGHRQGVPGFDLGRDLADAGQKFLLVVIALPPPAAVELDEMRAPALGQPTPAPGDLARIPNFDFSGHDPATNTRMNDDAIRLLRGHNGR